MIKWLKEENKGANTQAGTGKKATDYLKKSDVFQCTGLAKVNPSSNEENLQENVCCQRFPLCTTANKQGPVKLQPQEEEEGSRSQKIK